MKKRVDMGLAECCYWALLIFVMGALIGAALLPALQAGERAELDRYQSSAAHLTPDR